MYSSKHFALIYQMLLAYLTITYGKGLAAVKVISATTTIV